MGEVGESYAGVWWNVAENRGWLAALRAKVTHSENYAVQNLKNPPCCSLDEFSCVDTTPTAHHIFSAQLLHRLALTCCQSVQSHIDPMHLHGSSHEAHCLRFAPKHPHL